MKVWNLISGGTLGTILECCHFETVNIPIQFMLPGLNSVWQNAPELNITLARSSQPRAVCHGKLAAASHAFAALSTSSSPS